MAKGTKKMRTRSGKPSATARKKSGEKSGAHKGSFPIFDKKSADDALRLRGHAGPPGSKRRQSVISRARKYDPKKAAAAAEADRKKKKGGK